MDVLTTLTFSAATEDEEWYDPDAITTNDGVLEIEFVNFKNHNLNFRSGMLQSWNKMCFSGGIIEGSTRSALLNLRILAEHYLRSKYITSRPRRCLWILASFLDHGKLGQAWLFSDNRWNEAVFVRRRV